MASEQRTPTDVSGPETPIWQLMTRAVAAISPEARVDELARKLSAVEAGALAVGSAGNLIGIVSERDVTRAVGRSGDITDLTVGDITSASVVWCDGQASASTAARLMVDRGIRHLIVGEADSGHMDGIVSARDIVEALVGG